MTDTKPNTARKAKPKLDAARLTRLADRIEVMKATRLIDLIHELMTEEKAGFGQRDGAYFVRMAGLTATGTAGEFGALTNWANAARRKVLSGEAA